MNGSELRTRARALYHDLPVTPENSLAVRGLAWGLLGNLLVSDYLNRWNEAADEDPAPSRRLLKEAETAVAKALAIDPEFALAHYAQGLIHRAKGRRDLAVAAFDEAIKCDPAFARAYAQKASELINLGEPDQALPLLQEALRHGPNDASVGMFHWNVGRAHFFAKRHKDAIPHFVRAAEERPNLWHNWLYLASAHALIGEVEQARQVLSKFDSRDEYRNTRFTLARVKSYEKVNPSSNAVIRNGRRQFHAGLIKAGLPES